MLNQVDHESYIDIVSDSGWRGSRPLCTVYKPFVKYGELSTAEVSFPSPGGLPPSQAKEFGEAILLAVEIAERLNKEAGLA